MKESNTVKLSKSIVFKSALEAAGIARQVEAFTVEGLSIDDICSKTGIARSTINDLIKRDKTLQDLPFGHFFTSNEGQCFIKKVVDSALSCFSLTAQASMACISQFFSMIGISDFVATSESFLHERRNELRERVINIGNTLEAIGLEVAKEGTLIVPALDETFPDDMALVALDLITKYCLFSIESPNRAFVSWKGAWMASMCASKFNPLFCVADGAKAISSLVNKELNTFVAPDLFHIVNDINKALSWKINSYLSDKEKQIEQLLERITNETNEYTGQYTQYTIEAILHSKFIEIEDNLVQLEKDVQEYDRLAKRKSDAIAQIAFLYFPIDPQTRKWRNEAEIKKGLEQVFDELSSLANEVGVSIRQKKLLEKARRTIPEICNAVRCFIEKAREYASTILNNSCDIDNLFNKILPGLLILKAPVQPTRYMTDHQQGAINDCDSGTVQHLSDNNIHSGNSEFPDSMLEIGNIIASAWKNCSSPVEGFNSIIAATHRKRKRTTQIDLTLTKIISNFHTRGTDNLTPAERLFGFSYSDIFELAMDDMPNLPQPRKRKRIINAA